MSSSTITSDAPPSVSGSLAPAAYHSATGLVEYTLLNDYMFHIVFQDIHILKGFLCALLRLKPENIFSVVVNNPINPSDSINGKTFVLDIQITLNNSFNIGLELQVINEHNWPERSLSYLCRTFDHLSKGEDYHNTCSAIHISILDFTLFPEHPEFYASYKMMNEKKHYIYSDKFRLNVLNLKQRNLATKEDKAFQLDQWASLFKATTWEDIKMLAAQNQSMSDAAQKLYESHADFLIRENCRRRLEQERREQRAAELEVQNAALQDENARLRAKLAKYEAVE